MRNEHMILDEKEISVRLESLNGWKFFNNQITKEYDFNNFEDALVFVNKVGEESKKMEHHPDIFMHNWNKVKISISTHDAGGVTEKDFQLAYQIESLIKNS